MKQRNGLIAILALVILTNFGCKPDPLEYARPENLAGTIYQQLESMGTFTYYLKALDKTEYKEPLLKGGSWTVFVPTDEAFEQFMSDEGFSSFESIPSDRLLHFIQYSIINDGWNTTTLTYYPSQFYAGSSLRRRTQYQDTLEVFNAADYTHIQDWEDGEYLVDTSFGRMKTVTYFLQDYFDSDTKFVETSDYGFMFPGETYNTGDMKVFDINVSQTNVVAENGMIYALDKVLEPKPNMYQNLTSEEYDGKYTLFKKLLERFAYFYDAGEQLIEATGTIENVYYLRFDQGVDANLLSFSPDDENYPPLQNAVDRTLANTTGMLVPSNTALLDYLEGDSVLGEFYDSYDDMPLDVLGKFLSPYFFSHFWEICPSAFGQSFDVTLSLVDYKEEDIIDKEFCSNGFFVGTDKVYENNSFSSIMGPLLLDPDYSIMLKAVQDLGIDIGLQSNGLDFTIFGIKNDQFINVADPNSATRKVSVVDFEPDLSVVYLEVTGDIVAANNRVYPPLGSTNPSSSDVDYVTATLNSIVLNQIVDEAVDFNMDNYYQARSGEYLYVSGGINVAGGGDIFNNQSSQVQSELIAENGIFYNMSSFLERPLSFTFGALTENSSTFSLFLDVLNGAGTLIDIENSDDKLIGILNLQKTWTLFAPNNTAVEQAISDGVIPDPDPTILATLTPLELATAKRDFLLFVQKHFLQQSITTDGKTVGTFPSLYVNSIVNLVNVYDEFIIENNYDTSSLTLKNPSTGDIVTETAGISNLLSKRVVIHEIDNYIK